MLYGESVSQAKIFAVCQYYRELLSTFFVMDESEILKQLGFDLLGILLQHIFKNFMKNLSLSH